MCIVARAKQEGNGPTLPTCGGGIVKPWCWQLVRTFIESWDWGWVRNVIIMNQGRSRHWHDPHFSLCRPCRSSPREWLSVRSLSRRAPQSLPFRRGRREWTCESFVKYTTFIIHASEFLIEVSIPVKSKDYSMEDYDGDQAENHVADCRTWFTPVKYVVDKRVPIWIQPASVIIHDAKCHVAENDSPFIFLDHTWHKLKPT